MDFSGAKVRSLNIAQDIDTQRQRVEQAKQGITACYNVLANLPTTYAEVIAAIDAGVAASPGDAGWVTLKAEKDLYVADFQALKTEVQAIMDAISALG